jgi:hypothetical protein
MGERTSRASRGTANPVWMVPRFWFGWYRLLVLNIGRNHLVAAAIAGFNPCGECRILDAAQKVAISGHRGVKSVFQAYSHSHLNAVLIGF